MRTDLATSHVSVTPGRQARVQIGVTNTSDVIDGVTAIVDGINPDWVRLEQPLMSLFPDATGQLELVFDIPTSCPAGDYLVVARIVSTIDDDNQSVHDFWLTVTEVAGLDLTIAPRIVTGGKEAVATATVVNTGNCPADITVTAVEPTREVDCLLESGAVHVPQGSEALIDITMRGPRPWFGQPEARIITLTATSDDVTVEENLTFNQKPRVPRGLITILILAAIVLLWALIFYWVVTRLQAQDQPTKALSPSIMTGEENIPLSEIASTAQGQVTSSATGGGSGIIATAQTGTSSGNGIARITVEARRILADGTSENVGSAATEDDGTFSLEALLPGTYAFRFTGEGYPEVWLGGSPTEQGATQVRLDPRKITEKLDVVMTGLPGTIRGSVVLPPGSPAADLTATATLVAQPGEEPFSASVAVQPDGTYEITGLPTPGTYTVTVAGDNFETQQFEATLAGGGTPQLGPVYLAPAAGNITGTVVDESGAPLGSVSVIARGGSAEFTTTTPTTGGVGQFTLADLPTPQTYVLTFARDGFSGQTVALELAPGQTAALGATQLVRGSGSITGRALARDGSILGNIPVVVLGDGVLAETATLTSDGTFTVSDLPVPGSYSVTLGGTDYQSETASVVFDGFTPADFAVPRAVGDIVMLPVTSTITGIATSGGTGIGDVTVKLTDGLKERTTKTATTPGGRYAFATVAEGSYTVTFEGPAVETRIVLVLVDAGVDVTVDVALAPSGGGP